MNLKIDNDNIEKSFNKIADELINEFELVANETIFEFTEIEFYYFHEKFHKDNYTHKHKRNEGEWRFHNQGIDITFQGDEIQDGGILIRGIMNNSEFTNGPRKILMKIFEKLGKVENKNVISLIKKIKKTNYKIFKTFRHLPNKIQDENFHNSLYRYYINLEKLDISKIIKEQMLQKSIDL